jgi:serine/threonine protein kinase
MGTDNVTQLASGTVIGGRYEVTRCLGAGSMGLVYACKHRELSGHIVAVKVLFPEVAQDKIAAQRFKNEIFASYEVSHPNVVRAYEYIRDNDIVAYTMEYVPGGDLADRLGDAEPMKIAEVLRLLIQMCSGVQAIHNAGIIHRDLKPENILLTKEGNVKIADFGIARTGHGPKLTEHGGVVGTIDYVSPEYMLNSHVDWRSDIYAIGILAYEMITGESPFKGDSVYATMTKRLKTDPAPPSKLRRDCPPQLDAIILKGMARNPEERYQSAQQMEEDLRAIGDAPTASAKILNQPAPTPAVAAPIPAVSTQRKMAQITTPKSAAVISHGRAQVSKNVATAVETQVVPAHMDMGQSSYDMAEPQSPRMESVLQQRSSWDRSPREVRIGGGALDEQRMKRLSHLAHSQVRSLWVDLLTIIIAVVIGIGIGVVILSVWFPELIETRGLFIDMLGER